MSTTKVVSPFSATMIGIHDNTGHNSAGRVAFTREAKEISTFLEGNHHSRKIAHQQVNYSDTVSKLSKMQTQTPVYLQNTDNRHQESNQTTKMSDYQQKMSDNIRVERDLNERKRLYNREVGRKAVVNEVLAGTAPMPKPMLYPQKASHVQILAMTGKLMAPNANIVPPRVTRNKKWLGDGQGWEA